VQFDHAGKYVATLLESEWKGVMPGDVFVLSDDSSVVASVGASVRQWSLPTGGLLAVFNDTTVWHTHATWEGVEVVGNVLWASAQCPDALVG
jgi:hypothetical protein